jgi:hypothetical protein
LNIGEPEVDIKCVDGVGIHAPETDIKDDDTIGKWGRPLNGNGQLTVVCQKEPSTYVLVPAATICQPIQIPSASQNLPVILQNGAQNCELKPNMEKSGQIFPAANMLCGGIDGWICLNIGEPEVDIKCVDGVGIHAPETDIKDDDTIGKWGVETTRDVSFRCMYTNAIYAFDVNFRFSNVQTNPTIDTTTYCKWAIS